MCTAITFGKQDCFFGRNLDLEYTLGESIVITPRRFSFTLQNGSVLNNHYAMIGTAHIKNNYPLYYDAVNEKGLCAAGLNFTGNAYYVSSTNHPNELATYEVIPWILGTCKCVAEAEAFLNECQITKNAFDEQMPPADLHWMIADSKECITLEPMKDGVKVAHNPIGVLTNNPPFDYHLLHLNQFLQLTAQTPENHFADAIKLLPFSKGMGAFGLPGDLSSPSRFVRAAFVKWNSVCGATVMQQLTQCFHILASVEQARGCSVDQNCQCEITQYTACCDMNRAVYYYRTYENSQICAVDPNKEDLTGENLISFPMLTEQNIVLQNHRSV